MNPLLTATALGLATLGLAAQPLAAQSGAKDSAYSKGPGKGTWQTAIQATERGHLIGDPKAKGALIEFISYTCPHCASFTREGEAVLDLMLISPGAMSLEIRPVIRNPIDLAITLLAGCGPAQSFKERHRLIMATQDEWLAKARQAPRSQQEVWFRGDAAARVNAASALGLVDLLAKAGASRSALTTCLMDDKVAARLIANGEADRRDFAVNGTPSFALDGKLLANVHDWNGLYPVLSARFADIGAPGTQR